MTWNSSMTPDNTLTSSAANPTPAHSRPPETTDLLSVATVHSYILLFQSKFLDFQSIYKFKSMLGMPFLVTLGS